jgi:hypothetical protein
MERFLLVQPWRLGYIYLTARMGSRSSIILSIILDHLRLSAKSINAESILSFNFDVSAYHKYCPPP